MNKETIEFEQHVERGCGIDVHKETVVATIGGKGIKPETRTYSTYTNSLKEMKQWLSENAITDIAMESTGIYWKPVYNIIEDSFEVLLVNARHIKNVPGHKTDKRDSKWICKLLLSGLLKGSFIPPKEIRELRDLVRLKRKYIQQISSDKNRLIKTLEDANIKLSSVVTDVFGVSATKIVNDLVNKEELCIEDLLDHCHGRIKKNKEEIKEALTGNITTHHKFILKAIQRAISDKERLTEDIQQEINKKTEPYKEHIELLRTIPGVDFVGAVGIISEIGINMEVFPNEHHLASWAGLSPGNNESAGKKKSSRTTHGDKWLKTLIVQCAWAATRTKNTYLSSKYKSLVGRRGKKRALIAIGHKILCAAYHMLKNKVVYQELGENYLESRRKKNQIQSYLDKLKNLGIEVEIKNAA